MIEDCLGLRVTDIRVVALAVTSILVALGHRTLGLEVVGHRNEGLLGIVTLARGGHRGEFLGERLAGGAGEAIVGEDAGLTDRGDAVWVVDERGADGIALDRQILWGGHRLPVAAGLVELVDEVVERIVALGLVAGGGVAVFDFRQRDDVRV